MNFFDKLKQTKEKRKAKKEEKRALKANKPKNKLHWFVTECVLWTNPYIKCLIYAFIFNLLIETFARQAQPGYGGLYYMVHQPYVFLVNLLIIYSTFVISCLFHRQTFFMVVAQIFWMGFGITNGIILTTRMTPFTVKDFDNLEDGMTIISTYFTKWQCVAMIAAIAGGVGVMVLLFFKGPKRKKVNYKKTVPTVALIIALTFGSIFLGLKINKLSTFFGNLAYAYQDYGFPYCFINTSLIEGINKPAGYSEEAVQEILDKYDLGDGNKQVKLTYSNSANEENKPNILFLQLESFTDPTLFNKFKYSEDPIPYFRSLMNNYSSGKLTVPACGAGTANVEFEVMTGLSVKFFGPGEYPFKTVLKKKTVENLGYDLKSLGYGTHTIHNHRAVFYNRNTVFANMGYDSFTSVEYMSDVTVTPKNWAKDEILVSQIQDALESTDGRDYIYTISVQGHGSYPTEQVLVEPEIRVTEYPEGMEEEKWQYEYYVNQLHEMDQFVKDLTDYLSELDEPTVLVMYGDHIPALDITEEDYDSDNRYQTQYIIWDNYGGLTKQNVDYYSYELGAAVLERLGIDQGTLIKYNQRADHNSSSYLSDLEMLGYDMLYGKDYIYGGINPFEKTDLKMGVKDIKIDSIVYVGGKYYIKGQNFTERSKITLDNKTLDTTYLNSGLLRLNESVDPSDAENMKVSQTDKKNDSILSTTE